MNLPIIRLELENLRYQVVHALAAHHREIETQTNEMLAKAIESFDFKAVVLAEANKVITATVEKAVREHFAYGDGHKAIKEAVTQALGDKA